MHTDRNLQWLECSYSKYQVVSEIPRGKGGGNSLRISDVHRGHDTITLKKGSNNQEDFGYLVELGPNIQTQLVFQSQLCTQPFLSYCGDRGGLHYQHFASIWKGLSRIGIENMLISLPNACSQDTFFPGLGTIPPSAWYSAYPHRMNQDVKLSNQTRYGSKATAKERG